MINYQTKDSNYFFLIISIVLHVIGFYYFALYFKPTISFLNDEVTPVQIRITNTPPQLTHTPSQNIDAQTKQFVFKDTISHHANLPEKHSSPLLLSATKGFSLSSAKPSTNLEINFEMSKTFQPVEPEWELSQDEVAPIQFNDGDARNLINFDINSLRGLYLKTEENITIQIIINSAGYIQEANLANSTGDSEIDEQIIAIVSRWQFDEGTHTQKGILRLNYLLQ